MARSGLGERLARVVGRAAPDGARQWWRSSAEQWGRGRSAGLPRPPAGVNPEATRPADGRRAPAGYPGDFDGIPDLAYSPQADGQPDPGEIVWTWVPFEEDHSQGKDRPVLIVGRDGEWLLGLMLTSRDHDRDAAPGVGHGRQWIDIGTGSWDRAGRPSEVRIDRILRVDREAVRREGAVLARARFEEVAAAVRASR